MRRVLAIAAMALAVACCTGNGSLKETRGIGIYPGRPSENAAPALVPAGDGYRNLALRRIATSSSSYDYNLT
ncbi:MAG: hypothetical protein IJ799_02000, partial [Bacteroidales bacterium]|nr:hypothetical protein [Bacteroidales bacterium]